MKRPETGGRKQPTTNPAKARAKAVKPKQAPTVVKIDRARAIRAEKAVRRQDSRVVSLRGRKGSLGRVVLITVASSLSALLLVVLIAAFSPLLAVQKIEIRGSHRIPVKSIENALKDQLGKPLPQVTLEDVSKQLKDFTLIQSVSVVNLPPHTLQVRIVERQPICIIQSGLGNFLYDPAGVRIDSVDSTEKYPIVEAPGRPGSSPEFKVAIQALLALPVDLYPRVSRVSAPSMDSITFKLRGLAGQKVIWGDSSQAALKAKVLMALVKHQKKSDRVTYDVSSPKAPTVRY